MEDTVLISKYDVTLHRLSKAKIELVRQWRNDPKISQYMIYRKIITPEQQEKWFERINNDKNYYFIMSYKDDEVGLINIKDIDDNNIHGESGSFIFIEKYLNTDFSYRAHLCLYDYAFEVIKLDYIRAEILAENIRSIRFVDYLGFQHQEESENGILFILTKSDYYSNKNRERLISRENKKQKL
jgi:RimJ/RimL family protein N-acetyltransferase